MTSKIIRVALLTYAITAYFVVIRKLQNHASKFIIFFILLLVTHISIFDYDNL